MNLYILRHAHAAPMDGDTIPTDPERPLTEKGHGQVGMIAEAFARMDVAVDLILSSPYRRAMETATGLADRLDPQPEVREFKQLLPGSSSKKLSHNLNDQEVEHIVLVGHEPDLSTHTAWLIGSKKAAIKMAKGAIAYVRCDVAPGRGMGELRWLITPQWLAALTSNPSDLIEP